MLLEDIIEDFIFDKRANGRASRTIEDYHRVLDHFMAWYNSDGFNGLTAETVRAYLLHIRSNGWSQGTVALYVRYLRAFLRWLHRRGYTVADLSADVEAPKKVIRHDDMLTDDELARLVRSCSGKWALRDRALILFMVDTGVRIGELVKMRRNQVNFNGDGEAWLHFGAPKTGDARYGLLGRASTAALKAYLDARDDADPALWVGENGPLGYHAPARILTRRAKDAGIDKPVYPHLLRKYFATKWIELGGDEQRLMILGGWRSVEMLRIYVRLGQREKLRDGHRKYSPVENLLLE